MTRLLAAATLLAAFLSARAAPVPTHLMPKEAPKPFWPTAVGTRWVYRQNGKEHTEEITDAEARPGGTRLTVAVTGGPERTFDVGADGVTWRTAGHFTMDARMARLPLKPGDSWAVALPVQRGLVALAGTMTVGEPEEVKVPAGTFRAAKVVWAIERVDGKPVAKPETYTYWYAHGVGLVRLEYPGGEQVLKSFTPPRKQ